MDQCAYLVNSTPKYYYILPLHFALIRRYAPDFRCPLFLATEVPEHPICQQVAKEFGVELIPLQAADSGFLESRAAALNALRGRFRYVLPMQEDFLLDRAPDIGALEEAIQMMEASKGIVVSARLMPCPGAAGPVFEARPRWAGIVSDHDTYGFTFQATLWRLDACTVWYQAICDKLEVDCPVATTSPDQRRHLEVRLNIAENAEGQQFFWRLFRQYQQVHIGWRRVGSWSNAVYLSPWPYRPTAIVKGSLEPWAAELGKREGYQLRDQA